MDLSIIIPCHNEADNVDKVAAELFPVAAELARTRTLEIVFVDDGSTDTTWEVFTAAFGAGSPRVPAGVVVRFERHPVNRGLGAAIRTGFAAAQGQVILTTDCDGTYKFSAIPNLLELLKPGVDIVTASPYHPQGGVENVPRYRLILSQGSSWLYRLLLPGRNIHTYTALFRAYRRPVIEAVTFEADGFLAGTELMIKAMLMGFTVAEFPTVLHARVFGTSKAKIMRTIRAHLTFQWRILQHLLGVRPLVKRVSSPSS